MIKPPSRNPDTYELQPNKDFESSEELRRYAEERGATIQKFWKVEVYRCVLNMPNKKKQK